MKYYVVDNSQKISLFFPNFEKNNNGKYELYIDGVKVRPTYEYIFAFQGSYNVKIKMINKKLNVYGMFSGVESLIEISGLENINISETKSFCGLFCRCKNLTRISDISTWNCSNVEVFGSLFSEYSQLSEIPDISGWNTSKITDFSYLFYNCSNLNSLPDLSGWDFSKANNTRRMFYGVTRNLVPYWAPGD